MLAVREGTVKLYQLATAKFRLPGKNLACSCGQTSSVMPIQTKKDAKIIRAIHLKSGAKLRA